MQVILLQDIIFEGKGLVKTGQILEIDDLTANYLIFKFQAQQIRSEATHRKTVETAEIKK